MTTVFADGDRRRKRDNQAPAAAQALYAQAAEAAGYELAGWPRK